ncbi:MAG: tetratricopeptide repeat protein [candidate division WOR-3 bacterium]
MAVTKFGTDLRSRTDRPRSVRWPTVVLIVLLCAAVYLPTLKYQFVWDDKQLVLANPRLMTGNPLVFFGQSFMPGVHGSEATRVRYYRPLTVLSFWLDRQMWGLNPLGFHLTNVLLNALVLLLLALLLSEFVSQAWPVLLGVALFGLHPSHVESVAFVSGRTDLLAAVFVLACVLLLLRYGQSGRWYWLGSATVACAAALLTKEVAVLLPVVGAFLLYWTVPGSRRRMVISTLCLTAAVTGYLAVRWTVLGNVAVPTGTLGQRLLLALNTIGRYGAMVVFPFTHRLVYPSRTEVVGPGWPTLAGVSLLALLGWLTWRYRCSVVGFGAVWFLSFIVPASNLFAIGISYLAERLLYLPLAGAAMMVLAGARLRMRVPRAVFVGVLLVFAVLWAAASIRRMPVWQDELALFGTMVREAPNSADAHLNLGAALITQQQDTLRAEAEFRRAIELQPQSAVAHNNLGDILRKRGDLTAAQREYLAAIALDPGYAEAHGNLGIVLFHAGQADSAFEQFILARSLQPGLAPVHVNLGNCFVERGQPDSALRSFWTAISLQPGLDAAYLNLIRLYLALGKPDSAELVRRMLEERR